ncbi:hypothetical protein [Agromyces sp. Soil535]|uniref:hypothetical protein n=1 Tax=Agromyces sp. Soil535 TaxID=1736390 RepID=UPI0012E35BCF|nr:hypothetical protein [Agromyces sp. Soil535]
MSGPSTIPTPYGPATPTPAPPTPTPNPKPHMVGIIALAAAAVGFVITCIPGALIFGWGLMLIAFVLSLVALFLKGATWPAVTGLIVSIFCPIIALLISFAIDSTPFGGTLGDFDDSIPESSEFVEDPADDRDFVQIAPLSAVGDLAFGDTMVYEDGFELTVSAPEPFAPSEDALGVDQDSNVVFTLTITNNSTQEFESFPWPWVTSGGQGATGISDVSDNQLVVGPGPEALIVPGGSVSWTSAWSVADPGSLTMQVSPDFVYEEANFTNVE